MEKNQSRIDLNFFKCLVACFLLSASLTTLSAPLSSGTEIASALASAKKVFLYSLEPGEAGKRDPSGDCVGLCYYGWTVLGQVEISPRSGLTGQIAAWLKNPEPDETVLCFDPRHGIRVITSKKTVDFVICFECKGVEVYVDSQPVEVSLPPSNVQRDWDRLLKKAGIKLAEPYSE
jgi:hypothetical protein